MTRYIKIALFALLISNVLVDETEAGRRRGRGGFRRNGGQMQSRSNHRSRGNSFKHNGHRNGGHHGQFKHNGHRNGGHHGQFKHNGHHNGGHHGQFKHNGGGHGLRNGWMPR